MEDGRFNQATQSFQHATTLRPKWGLAHLQLGKALQSATPDSPKALEALQKAVALSPTNPPIRGIKIADSSNCLYFEGQDIIYGEFLLNFSGLNIFSEVTSCFFAFKYFTAF